MAGNDTSIFTIRYRQSAAYLSAPGVFDNEHLPNHLLHREAATAQLIEALSPQDPSATDSDTDGGGESLELTLEFDTPVSPRTFASASRSSPTRWTTSRRTAPRAATASDHAAPSPRTSAAANPPASKTCNYPAATLLAAYVFGPVAHAPGSVASVYIHAPTCLPP